MDKYYTELDEITIQNNPQISNCCDNIGNHIINNGVITCNKCINTISNIIDGPEWRYYGSSDTRSSDPTRCGMPVNQLLPESSIGTTISYRGGNQGMYKLRRYQRWNGMPYKERSLFKVFENITRECLKAGIPTIIIHESHSLYKIVSNAKISRGSNRVGIIAACVYFSCKINKVPRSTNEIADVFGISIPIMTKGCKKFQEIMQMNKVDINRINETSTISIDDFIDRFSSKLMLSHEDILNIKDIAQLAKLYSLVNENTPPSMASGCIYLYIKHNKLDINKKHISDVCKISEVTINKCYKKLLSHIDKLIL